MKVKTNANALKRRVLAKKAEKTGKKHTLKSSKQPKVNYLRNLESGSENKIPEYIRLIKSTDPKEKENFNTYVDLLKGSLNSSKLSRSSIGDQIQGNLLLLIIYKKRLYHRKIISIQLNQENFHLLIKEIRLLIELIFQIKAEYQNFENLVKFLRNINIEGLLFKELGKQFISKGAPPQVFSWIQTAIGKTDFQKSSCRREPQIIQHITRGMILPAVAQKGRMQQLPFVYGIIEQYIKNSKTQEEVSAWKQRYTEIFQRTLHTILSWNKKNPKRNWRPCRPYIKQLNISIY